MSVKTLGAVIIAALIVTGVAGANSASAADLCKKNETPCKAENTFPVGTIIEAEGEPVFEDKFGAEEVECHMEVESEVSETGGTQVKALVVAWKVGLCKPAGCEGQGVQLPWIKHFDPSSGGNGKVWYGPNPALPNPGKGDAPAILWNAKCGALAGCTLKPKEQQPGYQAEQWMSAPVAGGAPAKSEFVIQMRSPNCFVQAEFNASGSRGFTFTSPNPLFIV
jgi:hypothetical protein